MFAQLLIVLVLKSFFEKLKLLAKALKNRNFSTLNVLKLISQKKANFKNLQKFFDQLRQHIFLYFFQNKLLQLYYFC